MKGNDKTFVPKSTSNQTSKGYTGPTLEIDAASLGKKLMENFNSYILTLKENSELAEGSAPTKITNEFFRVYEDLQAKYK